MMKSALFHASLRPHFALCAAYASCALTALILLGSVGLAASLLFLPMLGATALSRFTPRRALHRAGNQKDIILGALSHSLGYVDQPSIAIVVEIDDYLPLEEIYGRETLESALSFAKSAIEENLTEKDVTVHLTGARFMAALPPQGPLNTEAMLNICTRIQHALTHVTQTTKLPVQLTASIGFASSDKLVRPTAEGLMQAAFTALSEAKRHAPNAVRGFSEGIARRRATQHQTARDASQAFEHGEIFAYFQPQIDLETGKLSGFEALARWHHTNKGILAPGDFLPALEQAGLMPQLGETMVKQAVQALTFWDKAGLHVPRIGVNFSTSELRNPRLVERIAAHLDVGNIAASRLNIEVLETVIASGKDDDIIGNLAALADFGCGIDLDDFGTGYASITNIRKFCVKRIKIDRSFISGLDTDNEQRKMVSAILTMADRLGVETLAEGVETHAEREALEHLGCRNVQGFQIARPMPIQETVEWANAYFTQSAEPVHLTKRAS